MRHFLTCSLALFLPLSAMASEKPHPGDGASELNRADHGERGGSKKKSTGKAEKGKPAPAQPAQPAQNQPAQNRPQPAQPAQNRPAQPAQPAQNRPAQPAQPSGQPSQNRPQPAQPAQNQPAQNRPQPAQPGQPSQAQPAQPAGQARPAQVSPGSAGQAQPAQVSPGSAGQARPGPVQPNARPADAALQNRARPAEVSAQRMNGTRPTVQRIQTGKMASAATRVPVAAASSHAPANYRAAHAAPRSSSGAAPAGRVMAHHQAVAAHRHAAAVRHHSAAVAAHHRAWAAHHVWRPYRPWGYRPWRPVWYHTWAPGYPHYWYHGVFVYGPGPVIVHHYDGDGGGDGGGSTAEPKAPERKVNREGSFSVGVRGGSYLSGYHNGADYGDAGIGLALRYRPVEALGLELQWQYHDQSFAAGTERIQQPVSASFELFAFPWSKFNPYVLAGVTYTGRNVNDQIGSGLTVETEQALWGPHGGVGLELGVGERASVNFDLRGIGYVNHSPDDLARAGAVQANMGVNFYF